MLYVRKNYLHATRHRMENMMILWRPTIANIQSSSAIYPDLTSTRHSIAEYSPRANTPLSPPTTRPSNSPKFCISARLRRPLQSVLCPSPGFRCNGDCHGAHLAVTAWVVWKPPEFGEHFCTFLSRSILSFGDPWGCSGANCLTPSGSHRESRMNNGSLREHQPSSQPS